MREKLFWNCRIRSQNTMQKQGVSLRRKNVKNIEEVDSDLNDICVTGLEDVVYVIMERVCANTCNMKKGGKYHGK